MAFPLQNRAIVIRASPACSIYIVSCNQNRCTVALHRAASRMRGFFCPEFVRISDVCMRYPNDCLLATRLFPRICKYLINSSAHLLVLWLEVFAAFLDVFRSS